MVDSSALKIAGDDVRTVALPNSVVISGLEGSQLGTRDLPTWKSTDGTVETGIWECDAGRFRAEFSSYGEMIHIVSGELECTGDDGSRFTLRPGDAMTFPRGWAGEWHIKEPLRKIYAPFTAS